MAAIRRGIFQIAYDILEGTKQPIKLTNLMYDQNMSYVRLKEYMKFFTNATLIKKDSRNYYKITDRGTVFKELIRLGLEGS